MTSERLYELIENAETCSTEDLAALDSLISDLPWFSSARTLLAKGLHLQGDHRYAEHLHLAAVYTGSRHALFDFIVSDSYAVTADEEEVVVEQVSSDQPAVEIDTPEIEEVEESQDARDKKPRDIAEVISYDIEKMSEGMDDLEPAEEVVELTQETKHENFSSFSEWLLRRSEESGFEGETELKEVEASAVGEVKKEIVTTGSTKKSLIDAFIKNDPKISAPTEEVDHRDLAKQSLVEDESMVTETMARIYASQGKIEKARKAYKLLSLKYPEKSVYFANQLKKLEN